MRIAIGGVQHETNTFAASRASYDAFVAADAWPGLVRGEALAPAVTGINLPIAGFIDEAKTLGADLAPLLWCSAQPSGPVTRDAFERIAAELLQALDHARPFDAIYLDLHGAMVSEHFERADAELLRRIRARVGTHVPIVASLDLHANVCAELVETATALFAYRTYPHVDMAETGARAARGLERLLRRSDDKPHSRLAHLPFLIPLTSQCTLIEPLATLMRRLEQLEAAHDNDVLSLGFTPGFPLADVRDAGPAVFGYGFSREMLDACVQEIAAVVASREHEFSGGWFDVPGAVARARELVNRGERPIVLADTQDNPGAGGDADTTTLLKALLAARLPRIVAGIYCDPALAAQAHAHGVGAELAGELGGHVGFGGETPLRGRFLVEALGDGRFVGTGPFYRGTRMELGPMAQLSFAGARIVVASRKQQAADQAMFRHVGIEPREHDVLLLKSSVHFRADFGPIARHVLIVAAPGPSPADPGALRFERLRAGVRLRPGTAQAS